MAEERFPKQDERDRAGGQHGTRNIDAGSPEPGSRELQQPSNDPQLERVHESAGSDDELGRGNDTSIEQGGSRHRTR